MNTLTGQIAFLEKVLTGNILSFAKGVGYNVEKNIIVKIQKIHREYFIKYKGTGLQSFDLTFQTNFSLPEFIGLGKGVSTGNGVIHQLNNRN